MIEISDDLAEQVAEAEYEHDEGSTPGGWYKPWAEVDKNTHLDYVRRARAGLKVAVPLIRAQVLREYADRWHYVDRWPMSTFGAAPTPYCACGKTWPEGGCTERRNLIADADTFHEPDEPAADVVAAFEAGEKGATKRPVSATAIRGALYDSLSPNFEIDGDGYDDAAVAVALLVDGVEP